MRSLAFIGYSVASVSLAQAVEQRRVTLKHGGEIREALIDMPPGVPNAPVLVALHWGIADPRTVRPVDETVRILSQRNGCSGFAEQRLGDRVRGDGSTVTLRQYQGCAEPLPHYVVEGGRHTRPGSLPYRLGTSLVGETNQDISATGMIQRFFQDLARR